MQPEHIEHALELSPNILVGHKPNIDTINFRVAFLRVTFREFLIITDNEYVFIRVRGC